MYTVEIADADKTLSLSASIPIMSGTDSVGAFMGAAQILASNVDLDKVTVQVDPQDPMKFTYKWFLQSGQKWQQEIRIDGSVQWMTFDKVQGEWDDSKFPFHRAVRDAVVVLITNYQLISLEYRRL